MLKTLKEGINETENTKSEAQIAKLEEDGSGLLL